MADKQVFIDAGPKKPKLQHSNFDISYVNNLTARFGRVYPVYCRELPAGSRLTIKPSMAFDMMPLVYPIQTNVRAHLKFYKIPMRILCNKFEDFYSSVGADGLPNNSSAQPFVMPYIKRQNWCGVGSLAEYFGVCSQNYSEESTSSFDGVIKPDYSTFKLYITPNSDFNIVTGNVQAYNDVLFYIPFFSKYSQIPSVSQQNACNLLVYRGDQPIHPLTGQLDPSDYVKRYPLSLSVTSLKSCVRVLKLESFSDGSSMFAFAIQLSTTHQNDLFALIQHLSSENVRYRFVLSFDTPTAQNYFSVVCSYSSPLLGSSVTDQDETVSTKTLTDYSLSLTSSVPVYGYNNVVFFHNQVIPGDSSVFDSVNGATPLQPINALPFRAYEFIHNYFFRNERVAPFTLDGVPKYNEFITNDNVGADETTPLDFFNALYEYDYFTTCVKEPQFGKAPLVGVTVNDLSDTGILTFQGESGSPDDQYVVKIPIGDDGAALPLTVYKGTADDTTIHRLNELISFGISINDLRNVSSFQRMLERYQRSGHKYQNVVYEFFGTNPPIGDHYPTYLGGFNANMSVQKITNMALSQDAKLGEFAGQGRVSGNGRKIRCFCSEPCYVIGVLYFTVTPTYSQYLPKHFIKSELLDYLVNPDFATLSPQPVFKKEIAPTQVAANPSTFNAVFGYQRPYADYVASFDEAHGLFKTSLSNFLLQRKFLVPPSLNRSFIEIRSSDLLNIFSVVEDEDKLYGQVYFDARVSLPLPRSYSPRSI